MVRRIAALAIAVALAACSGCMRVDRSGVSDNTITFGLSISLTGANSEPGELTLRGYQLCEQQVNAKGGIQVGPRRYQLKIKYQDDQSRPDTVAQLVDQFNDDGITFILGPYGSPATAAAAVVAERNDQLIIDSAAVDPALFSHGYQNLYSVVPVAKDYVGAIIRALGELPGRPKSVAFLGTSTSADEAEIDGGVAEAKRQGMQVLGVRLFPEGTTDVSSMLTAFRPLHPDLVVEAGYVEEGVAVVKQSHQLGLEPLGFAESVAPPTPAFRKALGPAAEGVLSTSPWVPEMQGSDRFFGSASDYMAEYQRRFQAEPDYHPAEGSAACLAMVLGIEKAGSTLVPDVRRALSQLDASTFYGRIRFASDGDFNRDMPVVQIQQGNVVAVWPESIRSRPITWPANGMGSGQ